MNFLLGGRMGDLIHALYVVKNTPGSHDLFITDRRDLHSDGFVLPLGETVEQLRPILMQQEWCNSVNTFDGRPVVEPGAVWAAIGEPCLNLSLWRRYAYSTHWAQLLSNTFGVPVVPGPWIKVEPAPGMSGRTVVHCSDKEPRRGNWPDISNEALFIGSESEYKAFGKPIAHYEPTSLYDWFAIIAGCKNFIGNQSMPLAIAHALDVPRLGILNEVDKKHYIGEETIYNNFTWKL